MTRSLLSWFIVSAASSAISACRTLQRLQHSLQMGFWAVQPVRAMCAAVARLAASSSLNPWQHYCSTCAGNEALAALVACLEAPGLDQGDSSFLAGLRTEAWAAMEAASGDEEAPSQLLSLMAQLLPSSPAPRCSPSC